MRAVKDADGVSAMPPEDAGPALTPREIDDLATWIAAGAADPLAFVTTAAPPAVSLLLAESTPADKPVQEGLRKLRGACGADVAKADVARTFGLDDVVTAEWPARIPVRCP